MIHSSIQASSTLTYLPIAFNFLVLNSKYAPLIQFKHPSTFHFLPKPFMILIEYFNSL